MAKSRTRVLASVALGLLAAAIYLVIDLNRAGRQEVITRFNAFQSLLVNEAAHEAEAYLRTCSGNLLALASLASIRQRDQAWMQAAFLPYSKPGSELPGVSITAVDETGRILSSTSEGGSGLNFAGSHLLEWAKKPENRGKVYASVWSRSEAEYAGPKSGGRFSLATPLWLTAANSTSVAAGQSWSGVLVMTFELQAALGRHLSVVSPESKLSRLWIMDQDGTILLQSEHPEMARENVRHKDAACLQCHRSFDYAEKMLAARQGTTEYQLKDQPKKLAAFAPVGFANAKWVLVVNAPQEEVIAFVRAGLRKTLLLLGLLGAASSLATVILYRNHRSKLRAQEAATQWQEKHRLEETARQAEQQAARLHQQYIQLLELASEGIFGLDTQGRHTFVNPAAARMLGYEPNELVGGHSHSIWHHKKADGSPYPEEECPIYAAFRDGAVHHAEGELFWRKDGTSFLAEYTSTPIGDGGKLVGAVVAFRDITDRKRGETERERLIQELQDALRQVKMLSGLLPICAGCKKIRDKTDHWHSVEGYISGHSEATFTHGLCPECTKKYFPDL